MRFLEQFLTRLSRISSRGVDWGLKFIASSNFLHNLAKRKEIKQLSQLRDLKKVLIISDINIGDAINIQVFFLPFKYVFQDLEISYIYNHNAYPLIKNNPFIYEHFPIFKNRGYPSKKDINNLKKIINENKFDLIISLSPFFSKRELKNKNSLIFTPIRLIGNVINAYSSSTNAHVTHQLYNYACELVEYILSRNNPGKKYDFPLVSNCLYLDKNLFDKATQRIKNLDINLDSNKVLFNPDTSSPYTRIPLRIQLELLKEILSYNNIHYLLLTPGYISKDIEWKLYKEMPSHLRKKIKVIPKDVVLDEYAVLIDYSEMFISGDTGSLHVASARKILVNSENQCRNSTAIVNIFGASSGRIYGYDSFQKDYQPTYQNAPSKIFEGSPQCKNITCVHKFSKKCKKIRCFEGIDVKEIITYIKNYFSSLGNKGLYIS